MFTMIASHKESRVCRAALSAVLAVLVGTAVNAGPREDVKEIASLIGEHYFSPQSAAEIVSSLEQDAAAGSFDRYLDRSDLAAQLTERLKPLDRHFDVIWTGQARPAAAVETLTSAPMCFIVDTVQREMRLGYC